MSFSRSTDENNDSAVLRQSVGAKGFDKFSDTTAHTGRWFGIYALTDSVITALLDSNGNLDGETLTAGTYIPVGFGSIQLTSGKVLCYKL